MSPKIRYLESVSDSPIIPVPGLVVVVVPRAVLDTEEAAGVVFSSVDEIGVSVDE